MFKKLSKKKKVLSLIFSALFVVGCSDSGGDDSDEDNEIPADFDLFEQTGTWRLSFDVQSREEIVNSGVNFLTNLDFAGSTVSAITIDGENVTTNDCVAEAPETILQSQIGEEFAEDLFEGLVCNNETIQYTKVSDANYVIEFSCDDINSTIIQFIKVDDLAEFNFGTLMFTSSQNADLNASSGVCGDMVGGTFSTVITPQPNAFGATNESGSFKTIGVGAPYNGNRILVEFSFDQDVTIGTYNVGAAINGVEVELSSVTFGGTTVNPGFVEAVSGNVNITAIDALSVTGSFNITTDVGDNVVGDFSFDIQ